MKLDKEYLIYNYHPFSYWIFITVGLISPIAICLSIQADLIYFVLILLSMGAFGFYLSRYGLQPIKIQITDTKIRLEYLSRNLQNIKKINETNLDNIAEFSDYSATTSLKITFYFKNKMTFTLCKHGNFHRKDDFEKLSEDLKLMSQQSDVVESKSASKFPKYWDYFKTKDARFWYVCSLIVIPVIGLVSILLKDYRVIFFAAFPVAFIFRYRMRK